MKIGELSEFFSLSSEALRFYEKNEIVAPVRMENGYREYNCWDFFNVKECIKYRSMGFTLEEIVNTMHKNSSYPDFLKILDEKWRDLDARISHATLIRDYVKNTIRRLENARYNIGHYWYGWENEHKYLLSWHKCGDEYSGMDLKSDILKAWANSQPFIKQFALVDEENLNDPQDDFFMGEALESEMVARLKVPLNDQIKTLSSGMCFRTVVDAGEKGGLCVELFRDAVMKLKEDKREVTGTMRGEIISRCYINGQWHRYVEIIIPCSE